MPTDIVIKHFEGRPVPFRSESGKLTLTMKEAGELLGYSKPREAIGHIYSAHKDEFDNECTHLSVSDTADIHTPPVRERIFTLDGLILLCMFSEQPVAKKVRHWLRKVGREVAVTGSYNSPELTAALGKIALVVADLTDRMMAVESRESRLLIPAPADNSYWPTPAERIRSLIPTTRIPKYFNRGGAFDVYASLRHARLFGGLLSQRNRRHLAKLPDYVIQPCPENDIFLRETFAVWLEKEHPSQTKLQFAQKRIPRHHRQPAFSP